MSTTVAAPGGLEITSNFDDPDSMIASLTPPEEKSKTPRVIARDGKPVKDEEKDETAQAASVLGKKGGEAAAKARKVEAKAKPVEKEAKPAEAKDGAEEAASEKAKEAEEEKERKAGNPRHDPEARVEKLKADIAELARQKRELREEIETERSARRAPARGETPERRQARPATQITDEDPEPQEADYDGSDGKGYGDYVKDSARWAARQERRELERDHEARSRVEHEHRHIGEVFSTYRERITGAKRDDPAIGESYSSFMDSLPEELVSNLTTSVQLRDHAMRTNQPHLRPGPKHLITDLIVKSENPRGLLEHFAENMHDFQRIAALRDPYAIAGEMAILTHGLHAVTADTSDKREVSRAGTPPRSVGGSPKTAEPDLSSASFEEHMRQKRAKA